MPYCLSLISSTPVGDITKANGLIEYLPQSLKIFLPPNYSMGIIWLIVLLLWYNWGIFGEELSRHSSKLGNMTTKIMRLTVCGMVVLVLRKLWQKFTVRSQCTILPVLFIHRSNHPRSIIAKRLKMLMEIRKLRLKYEKDILTSSTDMVDHKILIYGNLLG